MKSAHTPTPWINNNGKIQTAGGANIATVNGYNSGVGTSNATIIAKAVNAHEDLVKALEFADDLIDNLIEGRRPTETEVKDCVASIQAALSKAKGE